MPQKQLIDECVHCGFCLPACPTYQSWGKEMDSPRGRIYLMKSVAEGTAELNATVVSHFDKCLGCMGCLPACPSGVSYDALIEQMRAEIEQNYRRPFKDRLFRSLLFALFPYPARLKILLFVQLLYQKSGIQWLVRKLKLLAWAPRLAQLERMMPSIDAHHLRSRIAPLNPPREAPRARVGLISGCVQQVYFPQVNAATIRVLTAEGCEVVVPPDQGCCGALSLHAGREPEARAFARALIKRFEGENLEAVIVNAAGCGSCMKEYGRLFSAEEDIRERAAAFAGKVRDVTEFLSGLAPAAPRRPLNLRVVYHDACHLAHAQGVREQQRSLLRSIPGLSLEEIPNGDQCCGSAGIYNLVEPQSAREIGARKVENLLSVKPELMASANPGCTLQIQALLRERGLRLRVAHPIEILDASLRGEAPGGIGRSD